MKNTLSTYPPKQIILAGIVLCILALVNRAFAEDGSWIIDGPWTIFNPPVMTVQGIDGDNIVGEYHGPMGFPRGFLFDGTTWTILNMPGATGTSAYGIDGGNIVGQYDGTHGFLYNDTTWTILDMPGADRTWAYSIDGENIVGSYSDTSGALHGFLYDGSTWTPLNAPGSYQTWARGIDGSNIVGSYYDASGEHGFIYDGTNWTTIGVRMVCGIDGKNIVGRSGNKGFLYDGTNWTYFYMGLNSTTATDIDGYNIAGYSNTMIETSTGFIYTIPEPATLMLLGLGFTQILRRKRHNPPSADKSQ